jgi:hypothetical protein
LDLRRGGTSSSCGTSIGALLGEAAAVQNQHGVGVAQHFDDVATQFGPDRFVPLAGADEVLDGLAVSARLEGKGLGGLALQEITGVGLAGVTKGDLVQHFLGGVERC